MTEELLVQLIATICLKNSNIKTIEEKQICFEKIVNCAIIKDGKILDENKIKQPTNKEISSFIERSKKYNQTSQ